MTLKLRGSLRARNGRWQGARADLEKAMAMDPLDHELHHRLAPLLIQIGDQEGFRAHRARALAVFQNPGYAWLDCLIVQVLRREATLLIDGSPPSGAADR